jgi:L-2,4-diaminobutyrate decarboxylase
MAAMIDRTIELAERAANVIRDRPRLELISNPQLSTVVFGYVPQVDADANPLNTALRQRLFDRGLAIIGPTRARNRQRLKLTCTNPTVPEHQLEG